MQQTSNALYIGQTLYQIIDSLVYCQVFYAGYVAQGFVVVVVAAAQVWSLTIFYSVDF